MIEKNWKFVTEIWGENSISENGWKKWSSGEKGVAGKFV